MTLNLLRKRVGSGTAFGEVSVAETTPIVQLGFPYNLNSTLVDMRDNGGSSSVAGSLVSLSTGAGTNQSSQLLSVTSLKYLPGTGALFRGTAVFTTGVTGSVQQIGIGDQGDGFFFGYEGATFSVKTVENGIPEVQILTVDTASTTTENITITLDGDALATVAVTNSNDVTVTANEIAAADYDNVGDGWFTEAVGDTVIFVSWLAGNRTGTFSLSSATTAVGTFAETVAGVASTTTAVAQTAWNIDRMDGTGPSGMTLDPTKGNVYQIRYQWLGFGMILFYIEDSESGELCEVHQIKFANSNITPSIQNPTLPICMLAKNTTNNTDMVIKSSSLAGFVEGMDSELGPLHAASNTDLDVGTTEVPILSVRSKVVFQSVINRVVDRVQTFTVSTDAVNIIKCRVLVDPLLVGSSWSDVSSDTSVSQKDIAATSLTGGNEVFSFSMGKTDTQIVDVFAMKLDIAPGHHITITAQAVAGNTSDVTVSMNWKELF